MDSKDYQNLSSVLMRSYSYIILNCQDETRSINTSCTRI